MSYSMKRLARFDLHSRVGGNAQAVNRVDGDAVICLIGYTHIPSDAQVLRRMIGLELRVSTSAIKMHLEAITVEDV